MTGRTVEQLKAEFADNEWRSRFLEICDLMELLGDCIISDDYVVPDELNAAIKLTDAGQAMMDRLTRKDKVNAKDARLMCALTLGHADLFVDVEAIDVERLVDVLHQEILDREIQFPFVWGRDLYDAYASTYEQEKDVLTNEETLRLLKKLPLGVVQYGIFTVGPYGLKRSVSHRNVQGHRRVPAYHCAVPSCQTVHPVYLQTGQNAAINRHRDKLDQYLQNERKESAEWWAFADSLSGSIDAQYGDQRVGVLLPLLGDALSDSELKSLVCALLDETNGQLRRLLLPFVEVASARDFVGPLTRAQLLQICLLADERAIGSTLDNLVRSRTIVIPRGEVRRPVINRYVRSGAFRLRAELGWHGFRFVSDDPGLAILRERRLLNKLYLREKADDVQELEWQLRGIDVEDLEEKLEFYFRSRTPQESLERLALARRANVITACHEVGIENADGFSDEELVEAMLWKLGFPIDVDDDPHAAFWKRHERLAALAQTSTIGTSEAFMEVAGAYFPGLEGLLLDALAYTSWALLSDHPRCDQPFSYDDAGDREAGLTLLQTAVLGDSDSPHRPDYVSEKVELRNLIEGFRILARHLDECREHPEPYARPNSEFPDFDGKTELKRFVLRSTVAFLDLSRPSQERIVNGLREIAKLMTDAEVFSVRNDHAHYRRNGPDVAKLEKALEATRQSVTRLENLGFCRLAFSPSAVQSDRWGHARHEFTGPRSYDHVFSRPTTLDWMGLPALSKTQYLMRAASFGDPNEVLRFTRRYESEFSRLWVGFPDRRRLRSGTQLSDDIPSHEGEVKLAVEGG
ncbi:hypothetical protein QFZ53_001155 [Microbacterium natoriense]|uniref:Uncharacterized protein n=1 Tax=Microbacterium natoriense TaxID=284570 RepID=A0AAW8EVS8_9MICO|nr:hypothetical protein [Microbacterium natoriense]MDQ0646959.1 hypothetical protein [Microbacterium natoriense]